MLSVVSISANSFNHKGLHTHNSILHTGIVFTVLCIFKIFWPEDKPLCLKMVAEINTTENTVVLTAL